MSGMTKGSQPHLAKTITSNAFQPDGPALTPIEPMCISLPQEPLAVATLLEENTFSRMVGCTTAVDPCYGHNHLVVNKMQAW